MHDTADDAPVVDPRLASRVGRKMRRDLRKLGVRQPKTIGNYGRFLSEAYESRSCVHANKFMGPGLEKYVLILGSR